MQTTWMPQAMPTWKRWGLALAPLLLLSGCQNMSHGEKGALMGGAAGGVAGNLIAAGTGNSRTAGTVIGAAAGTIGGALFGNEVDRAERRGEARAEAAAAAAAPAPEAPTLQKVVMMTQDRVPAQVIIDQIRISRAVYALTSEDLSYLSHNQVHPDVIREMQMTRARPVRRVVQPVTIVEPAPVYVAPPQHVGIGIGYYHRCR